MTALQCVLANPIATQRLGVRLGESLTAGSVLLLQGNLGSGKTALVQGIGAGLGIAEPIVSPTFVLLNEYFEGRLPLYHFDLYRLSPPETEALYLENYWEGAETPLGIVAIEWAERLVQSPLSYLRIQLDLAAEGRQAMLSPVGDRMSDWLADWGDRLLKDLNDPTLG
jgi:tRNA threonylcarbamoyladenosine biosynthesis protein TsaE